jgi:predicted nucleotide-binding protein
MEWGEVLALTGKGTPYTGEVLDRAFAEAQAVIVLLTGDDFARLGKRFVEAHDPPDETDLTPQARPNVLFEAGMAFGKYPERTVLVHLGKTRPFSDVIGRNVLFISNEVKKRQGLADRLRTAGCDAGQLQGLQEDRVHRTE